MESVHCTGTWDTLSSVCHPPTLTDLPLDVCFVLEEEDFVCRLQLPYPHEPAPATSCHQHEPDDASIGVPSYCTTGINAPGKNRLYITHTLLTVIHCTCYTEHTTHHTYPTDCRTPTRRYIGMMIAYIPL